MNACRRSFWWSIAVVPLLLSPAPADDVLAGIDLFRTDPASTYQDFSGTPIPPDFFGPGSDPFQGIIRFGGVPIAGDPLCPFDDLFVVDTIVERKVDAILPGPFPVQDIIPIELVALNLVSVNPITVTYNGGMMPELWGVRVGLSPTLPSTGTMTLDHLNPLGGTFDSAIQVFPLFTFVRQSDAAVRILDTGQIGLPTVLQTTGVPWTHNTPPGNSCTTNFCVNPGNLTLEQSLLAQHGVFSVCPVAAVNAPEGRSAAAWGRVKAGYR
jgi:hypothetical protein